MALEKKLLILATLDTKGNETAYARDCAMEMGLKSLVMDLGTLGAPLLEPHISAQEVAAATGYDLAEARAVKDRVEAVKAMQNGGAVIALRLVDQGVIGGVLGMGGGTGTSIVTHIMRALPFGLPKVVVSTVASRDVREYVGTKDIVMFHSVADILGLNRFLRHILFQAVAAVHGMMARGTKIAGERPMVAVTAYGVSSACAVNAEPLLRERGYEMIGFHANGVGGMAMEEMVSEGLIAGVLDFTSHEIADEMFGGYCRGIGPGRFEAAGKAGIPLLFAPGGLDNAVFSPFYPMPETLKGRRRHDHDVRFCIRMEADEMVRFARIVAEKLNTSKGPSHVLIPLKGWSEADREGMPLFDPDVDRIFTEELRQLLRPHVPVEEIDVHISDPVFAGRSVDILEVMKARQKGGEP
jgi:uncharacterized protein (UPF0261 family)